jgi:CBS domain-containing protein
VRGADYSIGCGGFHAIGPLSHGLAPALNGNDVASSSIELQGRKAAWPGRREETAMTVGEICNRDVVVAPKDERIVDAAKRMRTSHVGDLVIVESHGGGHVPVGIVTDRDIVVAAVAGNPDHINYLMVSDVMSRNVVIGEERDTIEAALKKMQEHGIRRLPIVDGRGILVGILTLDDILRYLTAHQSELVALVAREQHRERQYRI